MYSAPQKSQGRSHDHWPGIGLTMIVRPVDGLSASRLSQIGQKGDSVMSGHAFVTETAEVVQLGTGQSGQD
jgi:hypothetical protein